MISILEGQPPKKTRPKLQTTQGGPNLGSRYRILLTDSIGEWNNSYRKLVPSVRLWDVEGLRVKVTRPEKDALKGDSKLKFAKNVME